MNKIVVTKRMQEAGNEMASNLIDAQISKCMDGLGGCKSWKEFVDQDIPNRDLIIKYLESKEDFDSVSAMYTAMERERLKEIEEITNEHFNKEIEL